MNSRMQHSYPGATADRLDSDPPDVAAAVVLEEPSFIRLVYSFTIDPRRGAASGAHAPAEILSRVKDQAPMLGWVNRELHYEYVLPHLADHLNAAGPDAAGEVGHWWTYQGELARRWSFRAGKDRTITMTLNGVELLLFRTGVGMLMIEVDPESTSLDDWQSALHRCRFYRLSPLHDRGPVYRDLARGGRFAGRAIEISPVDPPEESDSSTTGKFGFGTLISELLEPLFPDATWERATVPGLLLPFSAFFVDSREADDHAQFEWLYRWRRQLNSGSPVAAADHDDLHGDLRSYGSGMWLSYSGEGGGFFGCDLPRHDFFMHTLPEHIRRPYAFGFLFALHQRLALARFSERIGWLVAEFSGEWSSASPPRGELAALQDEYLEFLTRCRFVQVLRTTNHHENYREWERAFEVEAFADEVKQELKLLFERAVVADQIIDAKGSADVSRRVNAAVLGFALPTLVLAVLALWRPDGLALWVAIATTVVSVGIGIFMGWLTARYVPVRGQAVARYDTRRLSHPDASSG